MDHNNVVSTQLNENALTEKRVVAECDVAGRLKFVSEAGVVRYGSCPDFIPVGTKLVIQ